MEDRGPAPAPEDGAEHDLTPELDKAHNFFGPIDDEIRAPNVPTTHEDPEEK